MDFHELGMELCSEALESVVTSDEAQPLFEAAAAKFQEVVSMFLLETECENVLRSQCHLELKSKVPRFRQPWLFSIGAMCTCVLHANVCQWMMLATSQHN